MNTRPYRRDEAWRAVQRHAPWKSKEQCEQIIDDMICAGVLDLHLDCTVSVHKDGRARLKTLMLQKQDDAKMTTPVEDLAKDTFQIEARVALFGRPCGMILCGYWNDDGSAEAMLGLVALEPLGFARVQAALRFTPGAPLEAAPITEDDDACDHEAVITRHFGQSMHAVLGSIFGRLADAFVEAADLREDVPLPGEMPARETPAYAVH